MSKFIIKYAPEALQEVQHIVHYYNSLSDGLANRFKQNLLAAIKVLKANPGYNSFRYDAVRFAVVKKFPYAAHYTFDAKSNIVKINAILAFKQDPGPNRTVRF